MRKGGNDTGIIANVFGAFKAKYRPLLLSRGEYVPTGTLRDNDIVGAIADAIAKNVGKLQPQVVRKDEKGMTIKNDYLARILTLRPCPEMSTYDFLYRIAADLVYTSNSFSVIFYNEDFTRVQSIQPITTKSFRIFEDDKHHILFRFRWDYDGETYTVPYQNVIPYTLSTRPEKLVMDYCHIDIYEVQEMEIDVYLFFMREAMIFENSKTDEGREYLRNCWRMEQTKPDREGLRKNFRKKGG